MDGFGDFVPIMGAGADPDGDNVKFHAEEVGIAARFIFAMAGGITTLAGYSWFKVTMAAATTSLSGFLSATYMGPLYLAVMLSGAFFAHLSISAPRVPKWPAYLAKGLYHTVFGARKSAAAPAT